MTAVDRAADILVEHVTHPRHVREVAQALADAGLLVTDEAQAVLVAAKNLHSRHMAGKPTRGAYVTLNHAVAAYLASRAVPS